MADPSVGAREELHESEAIVNFFTSSLFSSEVNGETEKKSLSLLWKISLPSSSFQELKN